jgi:hypothetical protein
VRAQALTYHGRADSGRSRPLLCDILCDDGAMHRVYLKAEGLHEDLGTERLVAEWFSARLGRTLGLHIPRPFLVEISPAFIAAVDDESVRKVLENAAPFAFGSAHLGAGWSSWIVNAEKISVDRLARALEVYVFDTLIGNWDRSCANPNLLTNGHELGLIDHDHAFFTGEDVGVTATAPWQRNDFPNTVAGTSQHVLVEQFASRRNPLLWEAPFTTWSRLDLTIGYRWCAEIPAEWDQAAATAAAEFLEQLLDRLDEAKRGIGEALQCIQ